MNTEEMESMMSEVMSESCDQYYSHMKINKVDKISLAQSLDRAKDAYLDCGRDIMKSIFRIHKFHMEYPKEDVDAFYEFLFDELETIAKRQLCDDKNGDCLWEFTDYIHTKYPEFANTDPDIIFQLTIVLRLVAIDKFDKVQRQKLIELLERDTNIYATM